MSCRASPVRRAGYSKSGGIRDVGRNQHGLIPRKHCLAERDDVAALVDRVQGPCGIDAVWLVLEWLHWLSIVAVQATGLYLFSKRSGLRDVSVN
jgi:hypothetical protein